MLPELEVTDCNAEREASPPVRARAGHELGISRDELVSAVDVAGDLQQIGQSIRKVLDHAARDVGEAEVHPRGIVLVGVDVEGQHAARPRLRPRGDVAAIDRHLTHALRASRSAPG
jgi:hypothetical protein